MVFVGWILLDRDHHRICTDEPRNIVDVPVRVVADATLAEPDGLTGAEPFRENALVILPPQTGIPNLHVAEEPFFGHQDHTVSVDLDAAALEDDALAVVGPQGFLASQACQSRD